MKSCKMIWYMRGDGDFPKYNYAYTSLTSVACFRSSPVPQGRGGKTEAGSVSPQAAEGTQKISAAALRERNFPSARRQKASLWRRFLLQAKREKERRGHFALLLRWIQISFCFFRFSVIYFTRGMDVSDSLPWICRNLFFLWLRLATANAHSAVLGGFFQRWQAAVAAFLCRKKKRQKKNDDADASPLKLVLECRDFNKPWARNPPPL